MTISTRLLIGLVTMAALWVGGAAAQEVPYSGWSDGLPPDLALPAPEAADEPLSAELGPAYEPLPGLYPEAPPDDYTLYEAGPYVADLHGLWKPHAAPIEGTGTWLRRGFWYAEVDAVALARVWNRRHMLFASADPSVLAPAFWDLRLNPVPILNTNRNLWVQGTLPGEDTAVRATLGHFLFRDPRNRDHTLEFTAFGGGDWGQHRVISSEEPHGLFVPFRIAGNNRSFDGSSRQTVDYGSHFASFELNYRVRSRLARDRMIMDPNGHWHRSTNHGFIREYLVGIRAMEARDVLDWHAEDIFVLGSQGSYFIRTDNDMIGLQFGTGISYEGPRWSLGVSGKGGVFLNDATGRTTLQFTADDNGDADLFFREDELSFIGEAKVTGRWHLTPNFSLRAAYEVMYLTSQALAPGQATFITDFAYLNTTGDAFFHGFSFGLEGYW